jgi:ADP-heptose:LPS heptosyltransferase
MTLSFSCLRKSLIGMMRGTKPLAPQAPRLKVCIFKLDRIGDFILALGSIREITRCYGEQNCALVIYDVVAELARTEFPRATLITLKHCDGGVKNGFKLFFGEATKFRNYHFEKLICLRYQRALLHNLVLSWIHAEDSIGFINSSTQGTSQTDETLLSFHFRTVLPLLNSPPTNFCMELLWHKAIVSHVLNRSISDEEILPLFFSVQSNQGESLLVTPFSSATVKDYPLDALLNVLIEIRSSTSIPIVVCGAPSEKARLTNLADLARTMGISDINIQISRSVPQFVATIASARAILTVDTAAAHIATAIDKPTVVLLGGGHFGQFGPWRKSSRQVWLTNKLPCFGCDWKCIYDTTLCISGIAPQSVAKAVLKALA